MWSSQTARVPCTCDQVSGFNEKVAESVQAALPKKPNSVKEARSQLKKSDASEKSLPVLRNPFREPDEFSAVPPPKKEEKKRGFFGSR